MDAKLGNRCISSIINLAESHNPAAASVTLRCTSNANVGFKMYLHLETLASTYSDMSSVTLSSDILTSGTGRVKESSSSGSSRHWILFELACVREV